jgi:hypothetical protein
MVLHIMQAIDTEGPFVGKIQLKKRPHILYVALAKSNYERYT